MICDYRLKVFHTVAVKGSFTAAARELGITQPAVSNHISELEGAIGDSLFYRSRKETVLTPKGKILFDYAERILNLYRCADRELMPSRRSEHLRMVIAAVPEAVRYILKPLAEHYSRIYSGTEITVLERSREEAAAMLADAEADLAVTDAPVDGADSSVFATVSISGASRPMAVYYISKSADTDNEDVINDFLLCCRTFK
ncbi:MAG TPA: LysR family transcriptional regulator [Candidatus Coprenecus avistercoris]|uniref:LysR family transcriptional regulator n=1 Tax=Candidatus Coprenecus avistercoris TaxID=2840730 RepID=A0A9D1J5T0_9BACT|nr:LysR family transcriptional regulator [Candidatus Coprenecus avistercoris]